MNKPENNYFEDTISPRKIESVKLWFLTQLNEPIAADKNYKVYKKELPLKRKKPSKKNKKKKVDEPNILDIIKKNNKKNNQ